MSYTPSNCNRASIYIYDASKHTVKMLPLKQQLSFCQDLEGTALMKTEKGDVPCSERWIVSNDGHLGSQPMPKCTEEVEPPTDRVVSIAFTYCVDRVSGSKDNHGSLETCSTLLIHQTKD